MQQVRSRDGGLWERVFSQANMVAALRRVESNRGAAGVDGMGVSELRSWLFEHWAGVRGELDAGAYRPLPVRRVMIPKPDGGQRMLGVPSVLDRVIQQAIAQVLSPVFDPGFVPVSYGFRPGKSAHGAVQVMQLCMDQGYRWVVEVDLDSFFDRVDHDRLMARVARKVDDRRLLRLIRRYLEAGIMADGATVASVEGTPQGSPLSPLLSNIMLDDFDHEFWDRGVRAIRYADDIRILVRSKRAAKRALLQATRVLEGRLGLKVNQDKSKVAPARDAVFLGYGFYFGKGGKCKLKVSQKARKRMKDRIRELTNRRWSIAMEVRLARINRYVRGWMAYFRLSSTPNMFHGIDEWLRRRLRQIRWKEWKHPKTRVRMLRILGVASQKAYEWGNSSRAYWRVAKSPILHHALPNQYWKNLGLVTFTDAWAFHQ